MNFDSSIPQYIIDSMVRTTGVIQGVPDQEEGCKPVTKDAKTSRQWAYMVDPTTKIGEDFSLPCTSYKEVNQDVIGTDFCHSISYPHTDYEFELSSFLEGVYCICDDLTGVFCQVPFDENKCEYFKDRRGIITPYAGNNIRCHRVKYTGEAIPCCFQNFDCFPTDYKLAYDSPDFSRTCPSNGEDPNIPYYRKINSRDCIEPIFQYCTGTQPGDDPRIRDTIIASRSNKCENYYRTRLFTSDVIPCPYITGKPEFDKIYPLSETGVRDISAIFKENLDYYSSKGKGIRDQVEGNEFLDFTYTFCKNYPAVCQDYLKSECSSISPYQLRLNPNLTKWCGCYLNDSYYDYYRNNFKLEPSCSPYCRIDSTIKKLTSNPSVQDICKQNICLIDDVNIDLVNSSVGGPINFSQICSDCGEGVCQCVISNNTINAVNSKIGGSIDFTQSCGSHNFISSNPNTDFYPNYLPNSTLGSVGNQTNKGFINYNQDKGVTYFGIPETAFYTLLVIIGVLILLFLLYAFYFF